MIGGTRDFYLVSLRQLWLPLCTAVFSIMFSLGMEPQRRWSQESVQSWGGTISLSLWAKIDLGACDFSTFCRNVRPGSCLVSRIDRFFIE